MDPVRITADLLDALLEASRHTHPREFLAMLSVTQKNGPIDEFVVVPATASQDAVSYHLDMMPFDPKVVGSFHSHPAGPPEPSEADLDSFDHFGRIHFISAHPYTRQKTRAYDHAGQPLAFTVAPPKPPFSR